MFWKKNNDIAFLKMLRKNINYDLLNSLLVDSRKVEGRPEGHRFKYISKIKEPFIVPKEPLSLFDKKSADSFSKFYSEFFNTRFYQVEFQPNEVFYSKKDGIDLFEKDFCGTGYLIVKQDSLIFWQKLMGGYFEKLILRLKKLELVEFCYFTISDIVVDDTVEESTERGYPFTIRINMLLIVRSLLGEDLSSRFDEQFINGSGLADKNSCFLVKVLDFKEAWNTLYRLFGASHPVETLWREDDERFDLFNFNGSFTYYYSWLDFHSSLVGWFWFRFNSILSWSDYNSSKKKPLNRWIIEDSCYSNVWGLFKFFFNDHYYSLVERLAIYNNKPYKSLDSSFPLVTLDSDENNLVRTYIYSPGTARKEGAEWKAKFLHPHSRILGSTAKYTYESPTVLLSLIRSYAILRGIVSFNNALFIKANEEASFFKPFSNSITWFFDNIDEVMNYLSEQFPITFSVIDLPLLLSKQSSNALEILKINCDGFLELAAEEKDPFEKNIF